MRLSCQGAIEQPFPLPRNSQRRIVKPKMSVLNLTTLRISRTTSISSSAACPRPIFGAIRGKCDERWGYSTNAEYSHVHQHPKESDPGNLIDKLHRGLPGFLVSLSHSARD